ncbi:MAG: hypothetical protein IJ158_05840 [Treponema sp.]|nr:hypothetical protein [Treponema sp.]
MAGMNKCVGCGRSLTAKQKYVTKHGKLFHETCLDMFLESDKGKEWESKFLRSKAGQKEQIDEIIDLMKSYEMFTDYQEYAKIENDLESLIAEESDNDAYLSFIKKRDEYTEGLVAYVQEKKRQEEFAYEKAQQYMNDFKQVESVIKNTTFYENDENKIKDYLESIKYNYSPENESKLKKIITVDFKTPERPKNGLIIAAVIMIISAYLSPVGIILLIVGIVKKNKAKKAMNEAAKSNFELVKKIMYAKSETASIEDNSDKTVEEKISELYANYIEQEFDSDTAEQTIFAQSNESEIKKATESFNISSDEKILFGYDDTLKKSFKTGFVLTDKKLYFTDGNSFSKNISISVFDINKISFKKKLGVSYILINDSCISITSPIGQDSEKLCEILNKSVKILQKVN